jgi:hypothetical protein
MAMDNDEILISPPPPREEPVAVDSENGENNHYETNS